MALDTRFACSQFSCTRALHKMKIIFYVNSFKMPSQSLFSFVSFFFIFINKRKQEREIYSKK